MQHTESGGSVPRHCCFAVYSVPALSWCWNKTWGLIGCNGSDSGQYLLIAFSQVVMPEGPCVNNLGWSERIGSNTYTGIRPNRACAEMTLSKTCIKETLKRTWRIVQVKRFIGTFNLIPETFCSDQGPSVNVEFQSEWPQSSDAVMFRWQKGNSDLKW